jgi:hypothetical protein
MLSLDSFAVVDRLNAAINGGLQSPDPQFARTKLSYVVTDRQIARPRSGG